MRICSNFVGLFLTSSFIFSPKIAAEDISKLCCFFKKSLIFYVNNLLAVDYHEMSSLIFPKYEAEKNSPNVLLYLSRMWHFKLNLFQQKCDLLFFRI